MEVIDQIVLVVTENVTPVIIGGMVAALLLVLILTHVFEKRLRKRLFIEKELQRRKYELFIDELKNASLPPKETLQGTDEIAREYFADRHKLPTSKDYSEIYDYFSANKNMPAAHFSLAMLEALYSGKSITKELALRLLTNFENLVTDPDPNKIPLEILKTKVNYPLRKKTPVQAPVQVVTPVVMQPEVKKPLVPQKLINEIKNEPKRIQKIGLNALPPPTVKTIDAPIAKPSFRERWKMYFENKAKQKEKERLARLVEEERRMIEQKRIQDELKKESPVQKQFAPLPVQAKALPQGKTKESDIVKELQQENIRLQENPKILEYRKRIEQCEHEKKVINEALQKLKIHLRKKDISTAAYNALLQRKRDGKSYAEWLVYYDEYIAECEKRIALEMSTLSPQAKPVPQPASKPLPPPVSKPKEEKTKEEKEIIKEIAKTPLPPPPVQPPRQDPYGGVSRLFHVSFKDQDKKE